MVAMKCRDRLHELVKEEIEKKDLSTEEWKIAMESSFNHMDNEVAAMALAQHSVVNTTCKDGKSFTYNSSINIAVAVAINGGLITPGEPSFHLFGFIMCHGATAARALKSLLQGILLSSEGYSEEIKMIFVLGELGGRDEYSLVEALKQGKISKPVVAWVIGTCARLFKSEVQFGHAICVMLCADHGPCVSGTHNTIVTARAGKDLVSSLVSGLLTIGP
ncbi:unnamed protein product [Camellia sinensis]